MARNDNLLTTFLAVIVGCLPSYAVFIIQARKQAGSRTTQRTVSVHYKPREIEAGRQDDFRADNFIDRMRRRIQGGLKRFSYTQDENGNFTGGIHETRLIEVTSHSVEEGHPAPGSAYPW